MRPLLLFLLTFLLAHSPASSQEDPFGGFGPEATTEGKESASLVSELSSIVPGEPFTVALTLPHPEGWHTYYKNSGGVELPPSLEWKLPEGFTAGPIQWPVPEIHKGDFATNLAYEHSITLLVEITPSDAISAGSEVDLEVFATWQFCKPGRCENSEATLKLQLPVGDGSPDAAHQDLFAKARAALPKPADSWEYAATREASTMKLIVDAPEELSAPVELEFIPDQPFLHPVSLTPVELVDGELTLPLTQGLVPFGDGELVPMEPSFSGILVVKSASGSQSLLVPETTFSSPPAPPLSFAKFLPVLGGMLLGGLILNLMPCVFPVIGLKIMGFVQQAGEDRKKIILHGIAFTVGVLISFWILSGILFALRSAGGSGEEVGWGYQLQKPWLVLSLMLLMFVMGLSMYGVFEIGASATGVGGKLQSKNGLGGSFFSGVLATIVATPCSAPFLGAAIGIAVSLPAFQFFTAFTFMALGLSLPYLILSIFPKLLEKLPRPGPWMESFKQAMSFLLFATAGFLLWVYVGQIKLENMLNVVIGLSMIAIAAWIFGRWHTPVKSTKARNIAKVLTLVFAIGGFLACKPPTGKSLDWQVWSDEQVSELLDEETPVFVDFTAQWCATCQLNKKRAYPEEVVKLMEERGIVTLKADKTSPDPAIEAALQKLGRSAIPVNVLYVPGKDPIITPELLSADYMKELIEKELPKS
ncbi:protein-disulfide reductase DsbD family protein [Haloferula chungangensis]|uniref:Protein-disulfide reductase DsbD family protein n=1 Tax=Haloferula chungangensis TaxID=1048331 RepID=A0ABW2L1Q8_9BACT